MTTPSDQTPATQSTLCRCGHSLHEHSPYPEDDDLYLACEYDLCGCEDFEAAYCLTNLPAADGPPAGVAEQTQPAQTIYGNCNGRQCGNLTAIDATIADLQSRLTAAEERERKLVEALRDAREYVHVRCETARRVGGYAMRDYDVELCNRIAALLAGSKG